MKKIYILLTKSTTILSRIVHFITGDDYTHVSIAFEENLQPLYSSSRKNGVTLFPAGPCEEYLHRGYFRKHPQIPCALYELQVSEEIYQAAQLETRRIMSKADCYKFNIIGLIFCRMNIPLRRKGHYFCSQLVGEILQQSQAVNLPKDTSLMRPVDYMKLPELNCRYRGRLYELLSECSVSQTYVEPLL